MKKLSILFLVVGAALMMSFTESPVKKDVAQFDQQTEVAVDHQQAVVINYVQLSESPLVVDLISPKYTTAVSYAVTCGIVWGWCWCCTTGPHGSNCFPSPGSCGGDDPD